MMEWLETQVTADSYKPIRVDREVLRSLRSEEIFVVDHTTLCNGYSRQYY